MKQIELLVRETIGGRLLLWALAVLPKSAARDVLTEAVAIYATMEVMRQIAEMPKKRRDA